MTDLKGRAREWQDAGCSPGRARELLNAGLYGYVVDCIAAFALEVTAELRQEIGRLRTKLDEDNAVCLCGCPEDVHEADDCGESCADDRKLTETLTVGTTAAPEAD